MIKNLVLHTSLFLMLTISTMAYSQDYKPEGVEVIGRAVILFEPDTFIFTVTLADRAMTAEEAKKVVDEKSSELLAMAKQQGIDLNSIETTQMNIRPIFDTKSQSSQDLFQPALIEVSRKLTFILNNFKYYDPLLDQAIRLGVKHISPLRYETNKADDIYRRALDIAMKDAKNKAQRIAENLNIKLGPITYMQESGQGAPRLLMSDANESSKSVSFSSHSGKSEIIAQVTLIYAIK